MTLRGNRSDEKRHRASYPRLGVGHGGEEVGWRGRDDDRLAGTPMIATATSGLGIMSTIES